MKSETKAGYIYEIHYFLSEKSSGKLYDKPEYPKIVQMLPKYELLSKDLNERISINNVLNICKIYD